MDMYQLTFGRILIHLAILLRPTGTPWSNECLRPEARYTRPLNDQSQVNRAMFVKDQNKNIIRQRAGMTIHPEKLILDPVRFMRSSRIRILAILAGAGLDPSIFKPPSHFPISIQNFHFTIEMVQNFSGLWCSTLCQFYFRSLSVATYPFYWFS